MVQYERKVQYERNYISISEVYTLTYFSITLIMYINLMLAVIRHVNSEKCRTI